MGNQGVRLVTTVAHNVSGWDYCDRKGGEMEVAGRTVTFSPQKFRRTSRASPSRETLVPLKFPRTHKLTEGEFDHHNVGGEYFCDQPDRRRYSNLHRNFWCSDVQGCYWQDNGKRSSVSAYELPLLSRIHTRILTINIPPTLTA